jgi:hypothetical protein
MILSNHHRFQPARQSSWPCGWPKWAIDWTAHDNDILAVRGDWGFQGEEFRQHQINSNDSAPPTCPPLRAQRANFAFIPDMSGASFRLIGTAMIFSVKGVQYSGRFIIIDSWEHAEKLQEALDGLPISIKYDPNNPRISLLTNLYTFDLMVKQPRRFRIGLPTPAKEIRLFVSGSRPQQKMKFESKGMQRVSISVSGNAAKQGTGGSEAGNNKIAGQVNAP